MKRLYVVVLLIISFTFGCSSMPVRFPAVTETGYEVLGEGQGSSTGIMLFQFIPIGQNERFEKAYRYAVASKGGDALINPVITEHWFWAWVLNGYTTTVRGTVIKYKR
jgi:hypothetical protein